MSEMSERIWAFAWAAQAGYGQYQSEPHVSCTEYVRADLSASAVEALQAEVERLRAALQAMVDNSCAACDDQYRIQCTKAEWEAHVAAARLARATMMEFPND